MSRSVAVVGGGPTAVSAFLHVTQGPGVSSVHFVAPNPVGCAPAFGAGEPGLLCNTSLDVTSLRDEGESDLLRYLAGRGWPVRPADFVPRTLVSQYSRERFLEHRAAVRRRQGIGVTQSRARARTLRGAPGRYEIGLDDGRTVRASDVLFCLGGEPPPLPAWLRPYEGSPDLLPSPYPVHRLREPRADGDVLVLGTRLSAIEAALTLCGSGRRTVMASPSGRLPAVRTRLCRTSQSGLAQAWRELLRHRAGPGELARPLIALLRTLTGGSVRPHLSARDGVTERLRHELELAQSDRASWQDAVAEAIDALNEVLPDLPAQVREEVMRTHRDVVARYISAMPAVTARRLLTHLDSGMLTVVRGVPEETVPRPGGGWDVTWPDGRRSRFGRIVCATGVRPPGLHVSPSGDLRIGGTAAGSESPAQVTPDLRIVRRPGRPPERLWALGASAAPRMPIVNYLRAAAQHARIVARAFEADAPGAEDTSAVPAVRMQEAAA